MFKQSPSRNSRAKGVRVKNVLQICLLLGVCFWLIYQVKHSRDKKKEFDENGAKISANEESANVILKHGRKDLRPLDEKVTEKLEEEEEGEEELPHDKLGSMESEKSKVKEVIEEDVEENNHDEEEQEEEEKENKPDGKEIEEEESKKEETGGAGDEENEGKKDHDEEKMGNESNSEGNESEHKEDQMETDHEAREEQYNGDDASSAVAHDTKITTAETENLSSGNSSESSGEENKSMNATETNGEQNSSVAENDAVNVTTSWDKSNEKEVSFHLNSTATTELNEQLHAATELAPQQNVKLQNATGDVINVEGNTLQITELAHVDNNATASVSNQSDSNSTLPYQIEEFSASENITRSNTTVEDDNSSTSSTEEKVDSNEESGDANEGSGSPSDENTDAAQHNSLDSSMAQDVENRIDLDVLPEFKTEGDSNDDAAAE